MKLITARANHVPVFPEPGPAFGGLWPIRAAEPRSWREAAPLIADVARSMAAVRALLTFARRLHREKTTLGE